MSSSIIFPYFSDVIRLQSRVIQSLASFVEPILDLIADHTGWKVTLIAGGPEPADAGRLNMIRCV